MLTVPLQVLLLYRWKVSKDVATIDSVIQPSMVGNRAGRGRFVDLWVHRLYILFCTPRQDSWAFLGEVHKVMDGIPYQDWSLAP